MMDTPYFFTGDETEKVSTTTSIKIKPSSKYWINRQSVHEILSIVEWERPLEITQIESIVKYRRTERGLFFFLPWVLLIIHIFDRHKFDGEQQPSPSSIIFWILVAIFLLVAFKYMHTEMKLRVIFQQMLSRNSGSNGSGNGDGGRVGETYIHVSPTISSKFGLWTSRQTGEEMLSLEWNRHNNESDEMIFSKVQNLVTEQSIVRKHYHYSLYAFLATYLLSLVFTIESIGGKFPMISFVINMASFFAGIIFLFNGLYNLHRLQEINRELHSLVTTTIFQQHISKSDDGVLA